jgi:zinc/manganese transport system substrate-binding protein
VLKIRHAKVFAQMGLELDTVWSQSLLDASRNNTLIKIDCSSGVPVLERPTGQVNRSMGDVHPFGNPHYQLDPLNGKIIAANIARGLTQAEPANAGYFNARLKAFDNDIDAHMKVWNAKMAPARGAKVIDYHAELSYFANRFGLKIVGYIEPKPGVPPSPVHTHDLIHLVRDQHVKAVVMEQWYNPSVPNMIASETHCANVVIPTSVGGEADITTYTQLFDRIVAKLAPALK